MKDVIQVFSITGVYLIPAFFLPEFVPRLFQPILYINPFSYLIWCYQDALYFGRFEHPWAWGVVFVLSLSVFTLGYRFFRKVKNVFGDVL
jgi:lipopolysaccharide transport system permease protein